MKLIKNFFQGFFMALADSVPGVSGGTVAFVLGFYEKFVNSLNSLVTKGKDKKGAIKFLLKIGLGWCTGMVIASILLANLFESNIYKISSLFIGFIIFSIPLIIKEERESIKGKYINLIFTVVGILTVVLITCLNPSASNGIDISMGNIHTSTYILLFVAGAIAISAMILPGISGSTLLLIFGVYMPIINAIKELLHLNLKYFPALFVFGLGVIVGIIFIIRIVKKSFEKYRSQTIYLVLGLMIGSIYAIVMGPTTINESYLPISIKTFDIIFFAIGGMIIIGMEVVKNIAKKKALEKW